MPDLIDDDADDDDAVDGDTSNNNNNTNNNDTHSADANINNHIRNNTNNFNAPPRANTGPLNRDIPRRACIHCHRRYTINQNNQLRDHRCIVQGNSRRVRNDPSTLPVLPMRTRDARGIEAPFADPVPVLPALPPSRLATRQRLTQQQIWIVQHIALIQHAVASTTRGEFDDRLESVLQHAPPGSTVLPHTDNTHDIAVGSDTDVDDATSTEAADTDDIVGTSQSAVHRPDRRLKHMDRHIQHGGFNKARQALVGAAVANVGTASVREQLRSKYPSSEHPRPLPDDDLLAHRSQAVDHVTMCINDPDSLLAHIMAKKRGASMSTCGHSNDHYQDILRQDPSHILLILQLCNLIAIGTLTDGPARMLLLNGKGTALVKNITDVRPIVIVSCDRN